MFCSTSLQQGGRSKSIHDDGHFTLLPGNQMRLPWSKTLTNISYHLQSVEIWCKLIQRDGMESRTVMVWRLLHKSMQMELSMCPTHQPEHCQRRFFQHEFTLLPLELQRVKGLLMNPPGRLFCRRIIEARAKTFHNSSSMSGGARELEDVGD
jgi:hypothetical protein